ncbi:transcription elongation factor GreA [Candidatus Curtissbacteria bacterium RBG_16_39_7]|uniref:Transcription elongation factor GreA n=1 Tax=Candidatus Curtissbacteria bacterium RBG_16_39_7 TaxID=1797707 RepID=A0A1F5G1Q6_9BACT|nr:MAG: transcription elongation factor GreA [Candidatus Curtissbacteria bacterium RBG_16_39_7]
MGSLTRKVLLTQEGLQKLNQELDELIRIKRPRVLERIQEAREFGDLMENSGYDVAKDEQSIIEGRIQELQNILAKAKIITTAPQKNDFVVIGSTVSVEVDGQVDEFTIVGSLEADPSKKKISNESPVGQALLGARMGEVVEVITPIVRAKYKIIEVR